MPTSDAVARRVTVVADDRRYDLLTPAQARVADLLAALGLPEGDTRYAVATPAGAVLGAQERVGDRVEDGAVLTVVDSAWQQLHPRVVELDTSATAPGRRRGPGATAATAAPAATPAAPPVVAAPSPTGAAHAASSATPAATAVGAGGRRGAADPAAVTPAVTPNAAGGAAAGRAAAEPTVAPGSVPEPDAPEAPLAEGPDLLEITAPATLSLMAAGLAAVAASLVWFTGGRHAGQAWTWLPAALVLLVAAVALVVHRGGDTPSGTTATTTAKTTALTTAGTSARWARGAAPFLAFAGGLLLPVAASPNPGRASLVAASTTAAVVAGLARFATGPRDGALRVSLTAFAAVGVLGAAGGLLGWPAAMVAAVVAGAGPLVVRLLPTFGLDVPEEQLVDTERLANTIWSPRQAPPHRRRRIRVEDLEPQVAAAREVVAAGTLWAAGTAPLAMAVVLGTPYRSALATWCGLVLCLLLALAHGYRARQMRDRLPRFALLGSSAALTLQTLYAVHAQLGWGAAVAMTAMTAVAALAALGALAGSLALGRGWTSPRLSRLADGLETLAVVLSLPMALAAADGVETLRRVTSG